MWVEKLNHLFFSFGSFDPFQVTNAEQLNDLRNFVLNGEYYVHPQATDDDETIEGIYDDTESYEYFYVKLMNDIDLTDYGDWEPIGGAINYEWYYDMFTSRSFVGEFNGNNHTIKGLHFNSARSPMMGLFGSFIGTVENLTIEDVDFSIIEDESEENYEDSFYGCFCGYSYGIEMSNVKCSGIIRGAWSNGVGGLCGRAYEAVFSNCRFEGILNGSFNVGGIIGRVTYSSFENCSVEADIQTMGDAGGICRQTLVEQAVGWEATSFTMQLRNREEIYRVAVHATSARGSDHRQKGQRPI